MTWTVAFAPDSDLVTVTTHGTFTVADHARMVADILGRPEWRPGRPVLFDHRGLDFGDVRFEDMMAARDTHLEHDGEIGPGRAALLMRSRADYGIGRQFEQITADNAAAQLQVFDDVGEALAWLTG